MLTEKMSVECQKEILARLNKTNIEVFLYLYLLFYYYLYLLLIKVINKKQIKITFLNEFVTIENNHGAKGILRTKMAWHGTVLL